MKILRLILLNIIILISIVGFIVFSIVIFSETIRLVKSKYLYDNKECIRSSCNEVYKNITWAKKHFKEYSEIKFHYESPVIWKSSAFKGETINIDSKTFLRKTVSKNQILENAKTFYFFGGSVVWGVGSNDINTIPSHFQNISRHVSKNLGESAWTSDQSLAYLIKLVKEGHAPDYVIFINGANDVSKCRNKYGGADAVLKEDELRLKFKENIRKVSKTTFENFFSIPIEFIEKIKLQLFTIKASKKPDTYTSNCLQNDLYLKIAKNLYENWKLAKKIVEDNGGKFIAIIEPVLAFSNTKIDPKISFSNESVYTLEKEKIYSHLINIAKHETYIYDFKSIYNGIDDFVFIDEVHVSPFANKFMARKIYDILGEDLNN